MNAWFQEFVRLVAITLGASGGFGRAFVISVLAVIAFVTLLNQIGHILRIPTPDHGAVTICVVSYLTLLVAMSGFNVFILPGLMHNTWSEQAPLLLALVVLVVVTIPMVVHYQHATIPKAVVSAATSAAATVVAVVLLGTLVDALWSGHRQLQAAPDRSVALSQFFLGN